jgi:hypothetical protein
MSNNYLPQKRSLWFFHNFEVLKNFKADAYSRGMGRVSKSRQAFPLIISASKNITTSTS